VRKPLAIDLVEAIIRQLDPRTPGART